MPEIALDGADSPKETGLDTPDISLTTYSLELPSSGPIIFLISKNPQENSVLKRTLRIFQALVGCQGATDDL